MLHVCLFDLIHYVPSTIFRLYRDGSSWVEPVLSYDKCVLPKDHNAMTPVRLEPTAFGLESSTLPLSHCAPKCYMLRYYTPAFAVCRRTHYGVPNIKRFRKLLRNWQKKLTVQFYHKTWIIWTPIIILLIVLKNYLSKKMFLTIKSCK